MHKVVRLRKRTTNKAQASAWYRVRVVRVGAHSMLLGIRWVYGRRHGGVKQPQGAFVAVAEPILRFCALDKTFLCVDWRKGSEQGSNNASSVAI